MHRSCRLRIRQASFSRDSCMTPAALIPAVSKASCQHLICFDLPLKASDIEDQRMRHRCSVHVWSRGGRTKCHRSAIAIQELEVTWLWRKYGWLGWESPVGFLRQISLAHVDLNNVLKFFSMHLIEGFLIVRFQNSVRREGPRRYHPDAHLLVKAPTPRC